MPFPWNKHTISRFVADLLSPAKRDASLIVDTTFPTALVDLFVTNRDRLRNSFAEKHNPHHQIASSDDSPPPESSMNGSTTLRRPSKWVFCGAKYCNNEGNKVIGELSASSVIAVVLKSFVVVALSLSTKNMVVGIALSAIVLLLLEYVIKCVNVDLGSWFKSCSNSSSSQSLMGLIRRGMPFFHSKKAPRKFRKCRRLVSPEMGLCNDCEGTEFEEGEGIDSGRVRAKEGEDHSLRHRIKSRIIKKLQAFRRNKKEEEERSKGSSSPLSCPDSSSGREVCIEDESVHKNIQFNEESKTSLSRKSSYGVRKVNSGCLMLILIVLVGLVYGRIEAFVLIIVWCLVLKFVGKPCAYENVPMFKSLVSIGR